MDIQNLALADLTPFDRNSKSHPQSQVESVARSIEAFGFNNPILVDQDRVIVAGHCRYQAARLMKLEHVPCIVLEHLDPAQRRAYRLADNRIAEQGGWDDDLLSLELSELQALGVELELTGFTDDDWQRLLPDQPKKGRTDDDTPPQCTNVHECHQPAEGSLASEWAPRHVWRQHPGIGNVNAGQW